MRRLRFLNAGESHGPGGSAILEGFPAGVPLDINGVQAMLARRQRSFGAGKRMRIENDKASFTSGIYGGVSTGGPIALAVANRDFINWQDKDIPAMTTPRPGHADLVGALKFGYSDLRPSLERASARETATRVAAFSLCIQFLQHFGIRVGGFVHSLGSESATLDAHQSATELHALADVALENDLACPVEASYENMKREVRETVKAEDTLGGVLEVFATGLPPGLGSFMHWDRKLDGQIAQAMLGIQAMKGIEIGPAFKNAQKRGTAVHDALYAEGDLLVRKTNRAGGLEGGVTTGAPLRIRVAMKPIATTLTPLPSVDVHRFENKETTYERSDFIALPRAVPIAESMLAFVLANALFDKLGGDTFEEMKARFVLLPKAEASSFHVDGRAWRFEYPELGEAADSSSKKVQS